MGRLLGEAYVAILPDTDQFGPQMRAGVDKQIASFHPDVNVGAHLKAADVSRILTQLKAIQKSLNIGLSLKPQDVAKVQSQLKAITENVQVSVDVSQSSLAKMKEKIDAYTKGHTAEVGVDIPANQLAKMNATLKMWMLGHNIDVGVRIPPTQLAKMQAELNAFGRGISVAIDPYIPPDQLAKMKASIEALLHANDVKFSILPAASSLERLGLMLKVLAFQADHLEMNADTGPLMAKIGAITSQLALMRSALEKLPVSFDSGSLVTKIAALQTVAHAATDSLLKTADSVNNFAMKSKTAFGSADIAAQAFANTFIQQSGTVGGRFGWLGNQIVLFAGLLDKVLPAALTRISVLHLAAQWVFEFGAVLIPAAIAVTAWGAAVAPVFKDAFQRISDFRTAASATGTSLSIFNYNARGAVGPMQALQNKLQPGVWEIYGDAINVVSKKTGVFSSLVQGVQQVVLNLAARMTAAFQSQGFSKILQNGVTDFQRFGTIIGNVGGAFGNIIKVVPGYAAVIQELFVKLTYGLENVTAFGSRIIGAGLALHGFFIYAGLLVTIMPALLTGMANLAARFFTFASAVPGLAIGIGNIVKLIASGDFAAIGGSLAAAASDGNKLAAAFLNAGANAKSFGKAMLNLVTSPIALGVAAIGLAVYNMVINWNSASTAVDNFISNIEAKIGNMQGGNALAAIPGALSSINTQIKLAGSPAAYQQISNNWGNLSNTGNALTKDFKAMTSQIGQSISAFNSGSLIGAAKHAAAAVWDLFVPGNIGPGQGVKEQVQANVAALVAAYNKISGSQRNLMGITAKLMLGQTGATRASFSYSQALGILNAAGVQAGDSQQVMLIKVQGLLIGWKNLALISTQLGNSVNALALQQEQQQSGVQALTGAYSNFISTITSGETAFSTFGAGMGTLATALATAGTQGLTFHNALGTISTTGKTTGASLNGLTQASFAARGAFAQQVQNGIALYNNLLTLSSVSNMGAKGQGLLARAGKDMVKTMLPLAKGSKDATTELYGLAQVAGYQGPNSFKELSQWVGNTKKPMKDLNGIVQTLTVSAGNLAKDAQNLAGAMGQTLNTAMSTAIFTAEKGPQTFDALAGSLSKLVSGSGSANAVASALKNAFPALVTLTGSVPGAKNEFLTMAGAFHITQQNANNMWNTFRNQYLDTLAKKAGETKSAFIDTATQFGLTKQAADDLYTSLHKIASHSPYNAQENTTFSGGGVITARANIPGQPNLTSHLNFVPHFAMGGWVPGHGNADSQLAALTPGELVIPKQHAPQVAAGLKAAGVQGFAGGGMIGGAQAEAGAIGNIIPFGAANSASWGLATAKAFAATVKNAAANSAMMGGMGGSIPAGAAGNGLLIAKFLISAGLNAAAAAGVAATIFGESAWSPEAVGSGGFGLIGWTGNTIGLPAGYSGPTGNVAYDMAVQLRGVMGYINANGGIGPLNAAGNPVGAGDVFSSRYERPLVALSDTRPGIADQLYAELTAGSVQAGQQAVQAQKRVLGRTNQVRPHSAGGMISEPVYGFGKYSGIPYSFAEKGVEQVIPGGAAMSGGGGFQQPMTQTQGQSLLSCMQGIYRLLQQQAQSMAQATSRGVGAGVRHGYYGAGG